MKKSETALRLDPLIHEPARLQIMAALNTCAAADFMFIVSVTGLTRGNLSTHLARLVKAEYVSEKKEIINRKPCSEYAITKSGRKAYKSYLKTWESITGK